MAWYGFVRKVVVGSGEVISGGVGLGFVRSAPVMFGLVR